MRQYIIKKIKASMKNHCRYSTSCCLLSRAGSNTTRSHSSFHGGFSGFGRFSRVFSVFSNTRFFRSGSRFRTPLNFKTSAAVRAMSHKCSHSRTVSPPCRPRTSQAYGSKPEDLSAEQLASPVLWQRREEHKSALASDDQRHDSLAALASSNMQ